MIEYKNMDKNKVNIPWALVVPLSSIFAYLSVFRYKVGFLKFFYISKTFVTVSAEDILLFFSHAGVVLFFFIFLYAGIFNRYFATNYKLRKILFFATIFLLSFFNFLQKNEFGVGIILLGSLILMPFIYCFSACENYSNCCKTSTNEFHAFQKHIIKYFGIEAFLIILISMFFLLIALPTIESAGHLKASLIYKDLAIYDKDKYPCVIVSINKESMLCSKIDKKTKEILKSFKKMPVKNSSFIYTSK